MITAEPDRVAEFIAYAANMGAQRQHSPDYRLRDRLLADFAARLPVCTPQEREQVQAAIATACGIKA